MHNKIISPFLFLLLLSFSTVSLAFAGNHEIRIGRFHNNSLAVTGEEYSIAGSVTYIGSDKLHSVYLNWQKEGGEIYSTFFGNIDYFPYIPFTYNSDVPFVPETEGDYSLKLWFSGLNGEDVSQIASDTLFFEVKAYEYLPNRQLSLLESFSSINCGSCALVAPRLTSMIKDNIDNYAMIYYHPLEYENSPLHLFNPKDQLTRKNFYGVTYTPVSAVGSIYFGGSEGIDKSYMELELAKKAAFKIEGSWFVENNEIQMTVSSECFADLSQNDLRLMTVLTEDSVGFDSAPGSNGEKDFYFVMRYFFPDANGTSLVNQLPGSTTETELKQIVDLEKVDTTQLSILAFIQDMESGEIFQTVRLENEEQNHVSSSFYTLLPEPIIFPNPSSGSINIRIPKGIQVKEIIIIDINGNTIKSINSDNIISGKLVRVEAKDLKDGLYILGIVTPDNILRKKFSICNEF